MYILLLEFIGIMTDTQKVIATGSYGPVEKALSLGGRCRTMCEIPARSLRSESEIQEVETELRGGAGEKVTASMNEISPKITSSYTLSSDQITAPEPDLKEVPYVVVRSSRYGSGPTDIRSMVLILIIVVILVMALSGGSDSEVAGRGEESSCGGNDDSMDILKEVF